MSLLFLVKHSCFSIPAAQTVLAAIAGKLREFDKLNDDCPATIRILQTILQTHPKFVEERADLDEEERDEVMLVYAFGRARRLRH
ncbi:MAG: hypothetical protein OXG29_08655 [Gammaproteobacteria bacterium]|nr:hypothetical protein [Gammaproteobacteria bacterium]